jgi:DnaJ-domain-containing protein 1
MSYDRESIERGYETLGVNARDSAPSIRRRYRQLVKRWHPDRFREGSQAHDQATLRIRAINAAYAQIKDAPLRRAAVLPTRPVAAQAGARRSAPAPTPPPPRRSSGVALAATAGLAVGLFIELLVPMGRQMLGQAAGWMVFPIVGAALGPVFRGVLGRTA